MFRKGGICVESLMREIVMQYGLTALEVEQHGDRLFKVYTNHGAVAVKRTSLEESQLDSWLEAYKMANTHRLKSIIPLYVTTNQQFYVKRQEGIFYAMPWMEERHRDTPTYHFESLYTCLGEIHHRTSTAKVVKQEDFENYVEGQKNKIRTYKNTLESALEKFEKRHYMPPIELQICTHFHDILRVFELSEEWGERFLEDIEEDKLIRTSLCHGNVKASHFIYDNNQSCFINWERATVNNPVYDLTNYYWNLLRYHDAPVEQLIKAFHSYEDQYPLLNSERSLFAMFLLNPEHYMEQVNEYVNGARSKGQPFLIQKLERTYFVLQHGLHIQEQLQQARSYIQQQKLKEEEEDS